VFSLEKPEVDFDLRHDGNRDSVHRAGIELPASDGFDCFLIETVAEAVDQRDVFGQAIDVYHDLQQYSALELGGAAVLAVGRFHLRDEVGRGHAVADSGRGGGSDGTSAEGGGASLADSGGTGGDGRGFVGPVLVLQEAGVELEGE